MRSWTVVGSAAEPETSSRAPAKASASSPIVGGLARDPRVHGGHAEHHGGAAPERLRQRLSGEAADVLDLPAAAQRAQHADDQPVHVEHRQRVRDPVIGGPLPDLGQRIEVGGDRSSRDLDALRRPGGARRVHHERHVLLGELVPEPGVARAEAVEIDVESGHARELLGRLDPGPGQQPLGAAVGDDVLELARAETGVERHHGHPGGERPDDRDARLECRLGPDRDPVGAVELRRHGGGGAGQLAVRECVAPTRIASSSSGSISRGKRASVIWSPPLYSLKY